ncbi:MAG TPA: DEAD/DEAH box helicase [Solirubrobacteraceae bacterium]|nr:DEAD/DEAH box helicase [Solirubrobacteraceae bacterium]
MDSFTSAARERLRTLTDDPAAEFREGQLEAIGDLVVDRGRVLCVQRTGWGKSAVYFVATSLLRDPPAGSEHAATGPTLIISPLLALMRNQLAAASRLGLSAHTINSTNPEEWDGVRDRLATGTLDLLLVSPERLNNTRFREQMLPLFAQTLGLLVIDEAHCISDWGHDFRPDYRRVGDLLAALAGRAQPGAVPVLATTATANDRVVADVTEQLSAGAPGGGGSAAGGGAASPSPLRTYRGPLARASLRLEVVELARPAERLAWLVEQLPSLAGSGIVYTLTRRDADQVTEFLTANRIPALAYSGDQDSEARIGTERRLLANAVKAVVATSALGMGYDKPDLGFVVHYQAPGSVVAYYQQVGRAGRAVPHADAVLLRGAEDRRIQDFFIEQSFPARERVQAVLAALEAVGESGRSTRELMAVVNLGMSRLEAMLKILDVEGAVQREGSRWVLAASAATWEYDAERYAHVTALRRAEQEAMARYGADGRCLMRVLQEELDDPRPEDCGRCAVCTAPRFAAPPEPRLVELAGRHLRARPIELEAKKMAPDAQGTMRRIPENVRIEPGWALARFGDGGWWPAVSRGLESGRFDEEVVQALADIVRAHVPAAAWLCAVPSARLGDVLEVLGGRVADAVGIASHALLTRAEARPPQREMENAVGQAANVRGAFRVTGTPPRGTGVLLDDRRGSGWTLAMAGGQLRMAGAERVVPLTLGTLL